jgi:Fic family protein
LPGQYISRTWKHDPTLNAPARYRRACRYEAFIPVPLAELSVNVDGTLAGLIAEAHEAVRALNTSADPGLGPLGRLLLRSESIASSRIEGLQTGLRDLARAEARLETGGKAGPVAIEVLANIDAMQLAVQHTAEAPRLTVAAMNAIHKRLMQGAVNAARIAGKVRTSQNWIGGNDYNPCGAAFVPPPPEDVARLMKDLCVGANDDLLPPLVQAALVHAQFETIHPYADGNGRTGRALIHAILRRRQVATHYVPPVSVVLAASRDSYIAGLTAFRGDDINVWIERFAGAMHRAATLATAYLAKVAQLAERWRESLSDTRTPPRADATAWRIIEALPAHPIISAQVATSATGRSRPQVYDALAQLESAGVLVPLSAGKRNRAWEAAGLLELLEDLDAAAP